MVKICRTHERAISINEALRGWRPLVLLCSYCDSCNRATSGRNRSKPFNGAVVRTACGSPKPLPFESRHKPLIPVVKAAEFRLCHDRAAIHHLALHRTLFAQPQVCPRPVVVGQVGGQRPFQVARTQDNEVVQALPSDRSDQAFRVSVLPWALGRCQLLAYP